MKFPWYSPGSDSWDHLELTSNRLSYGSRLARHCKITTPSRSLERPHKAAETIRRITLPCTEGPPQEPSLVLEATRKEKRWRNSSAQTLLGVGHYALAGQLVPNLVEFPCYDLPFSLLFWPSFSGQGGEGGDQSECLPHSTLTRIGRAQETIALTPFGSE